MSRQREGWLSEEKEEHISQREEWISRQEKWRSEEKEWRVSKQVELMALNQDTIPRLHKDIFSASAIFYSYACRTATGIGAEPEKEADPHAEDSLAQLIANYFKIKVRAFYRRTDYKYVMIPKEKYDDTTKAKIKYDDKSSAISAIMRQKRASGFEEQSFDINGEYEALLDPENGYGGWPRIIREGQAGVKRGGPVAEGTTSYALWRKGGALSLPAAAETPKGFPADFAEFEPDGK